MQTILSTNLKYIEYFYWLYRIYCNIFTKNEQFNGIYILTFFFRVKVEVWCIKLINKTYYQGITIRHIILKQFRPGDAVKKNTQKKTLAEYASLKI